MEDGTLDYRGSAPHQRPRAMPFFTWVWLLCALTVTGLHVASEFVYGFTDPHDITHFERWLEKVCTGFMWGELVWGIFSVSFVCFLSGAIDAFDREKLVASAVISWMMLLYEPHLRMIV